MTDIVKRVEELFKMPQSLCKGCAKCCKMGIFKGDLSYEEVLELANSKTADPSQIEGARDFLSTFKPFDSVEEARKVDAEFVDDTYKRIGTTDHKVAFFYCRYVGDDNRCLIHEDRPFFCRMYPIPHERVQYFSGCGFKELGEKNWAEIKKIMQELGIK